MSLKAVMQQQEAKLQHKRTRKEATDENESDEDDEDERMRGLKGVRRGGRDSFSEDITATSTHHRPSSVFKLRHQQQQQRMSSSSMAPLQKEDDAVAERAMRALAAKAKLYDQLQQSGGRLMTDANDAGASNSKIVSSSVSLVDFSVRPSLSGPDNDLKVPGRSDDSSIRQDEAAHSKDNPDGLAADRVPRRSRFSVWGDENESQSSTSIPASAAACGDTSSSQFPALHSNDGQPKQSQPSKAHAVYSYYGPSMPSTSPALSATMTASTATTSSATSFTPFVPTAHTLPTHTVYTYQYPTEQPNLPRQSQPQPAVRVPPQPQPQWQWSRGQKSVEDHGLASAGSSTNTMGAGANIETGTVEAYKAERQGERLLQRVVEQSLASVTPRPTERDHKEEAMMQQRKRVFAQSHSATADANGGHREDTNASEDHGTHGALSHGARVKSAPWEKLLGHEARVLVEEVHAETERMRAQRTMPQQERASGDRDEGDKDKTEGKRGTSHGDTSIPAHSAVGSVSTVQQQRMALLQRKRQQLLEQREKKL